MIDDAFTLLGEQGPVAVIDFLNASDEPQLAVKAYSQLVVKSYWEKKDLNAVVALATAGIGLAMDAASQRDAETAAHLLGLAKAMAYNLASFTWPGWDEPGISIDAVQISLGLDAAQTNLRIAQELGRGDLPLSRAHWMLGAQYWAAGDCFAALEAFADAERYAKLAEAKGEELLARGFEMAVKLAESNDADVSNELVGLKAELVELEHGAGFVEQIETALRVFGGNG